MKKMYNNPETEIAAMGAERLMQNISVSEGTAETPPIPHAPTNRNVVIGE